MNNKAAVNKLVEHFFRYESGKMISVLTGLFGADNLMLAEDIVQETLIEAISNWTYKGIPEKPVAWLYKVAKHKTLNVLKREKYQSAYIAEAIPLLKDKQVVEIDLAHLFAKKSIEDDQLSMMFMCCHASISKDSQIALILKTLCGFSINEIAKAFLSNNENINKRLVRARKKIRRHKIPFEVPKKEELDNKVDAVLEAIYLLFNEGYSASTGKQLIRQELCTEAIRLAKIIAQHESIIHKTNVYALLALMQLNASRFASRSDEKGNIFTLSQQNRTLWDFQLMEKGFSNLERSTHGIHITSYHILASISAYHCAAKDFDSTDWKGILSLYDKLITIDKSPIVLLNRAIALSKTSYVKEALEELNKNEKYLGTNYLFHSTKATFCIQLNKLTAAKSSLNKAIQLAPLAAEKKLLADRFAYYFDKK